MNAQYFAQINPDNVVVNVAVVQQEFLQTNPELYPGTWVETFINDAHTYAGIGYTYNETTQDFVAPPTPKPTVSDVEA